METLKIATRSSPLALWQARYVADNLEKCGLKTQLLPLETIGDKKLEVALSKIGDKGVFTQELEHLLLTGEAQLAVHSAKDMPSSLPESLELLAFTEREKPIDVLVSFRSDANLDQNLIVGTSASRRVAILKRYYPHIKTVTVRGNLQTRFRKMEEGQCDALLLAYAGVHRMGFAHLISQQLDPAVFTPAVGQGSIAVEINKNLSAELKAVIKAAVNHPETAIGLLAERSFLHTMEGGCSVPAFAHAHVETNGLVLSGGIISLDGKDEVRHSETIPEVSEEAAIDLGYRVAKAILNSGGDSILAKIKQHLHP